jgi:hypothetical protein
MFALFLFPLTSWSQERVVLVVKTFTVNSESVFPYDMKQLQISTHALLKTRFAKDAVDVVTEETSAGGGNVYVVTGEFSNWQGGSTAKRIVVGFGAGREGVDFRFSITDQAGKKVVDRTERIKAQFWGSGAQGNVGQLAGPIADKIGDRIENAKVVQKKKS